MISFLSSWLHRFPKKEVLSNGHQLGDINNLIIDIALSSNINDFLTHYLKSVQNFVAETLHGDVLLVSPSLSANNVKILCSDTLSPSVELLKEITHKLSLEQNNPNEQLRLILSDSKLSAHCQRIQYGPLENSSWLILCFKNSFPSNEVICHQTKSIVNAFEKGFSAWYKQQIKIQESIDVVKAEHAAELHDTLVQTLGYLRIKSCCLVEYCEKNGEELLINTSQDISDQIKLAYRQSRDLVSISRLSVLEGGLIKMVLDSIEEFEQRSGVVFEFDNRVDSTVTTTDDTQVLYIIREAISNVIRHSHATHARIIIKKINHSLFFRVEDNGRGIDEALIRHDSFGMKIMKERANKLSADLAILPRKHGGTCIELKVMECK